LGHCGGKRKTLDRAAPALTGEFVVGTLRG